MRGYDISDSGRLPYGAMAIPTPPRAVTFDCWATLINDLSWDKTVEVRVRHILALADREGCPIDPEKAAELLESSWQNHVSEWRAGRIYGSRGASRWVLEQLGLDVTEHLADELAEAIEGATSESGTFVVEGAVEAVDMLRSHGISTALICDTGFTPGRHVRRFLDAHGIKLDHYFFSDAVGSPKPLPPIFHAALDATQSKPEEAVHIGDLRRTDIAGARAVGMGTIRFTGIHDDGWAPEEATGDEADAVLNRWADLASLLGL